MNPWERWVAFTGREVDSRPLRLVRVLVPLCILGDLLSSALHGVLPQVLYPASLGGLSAETASWYLLDGIGWGGPLLFGVALLAAPFAARGGVGTRIATVALLIASAQLGHLYPPGDRAIDRILRTTLLLLVFSAVSAPRVPSRVAAWPSDLLRWLLAIIYLQAGIVKLGAKPGWTSLVRSDLYEVMCNPMIGRLDGVTWEPLMPLFAAGGAATLVLELSAPLLITRWAPWWAMGGALIHIGIALTMDLGVFPYGMLAVYPVILGPFLLRALDRLAPWLPRGWGPPDATDP